MLLRTSSATVRTRAPSRYSSHSKLAPIAPGAVRKQRCHDSSRSGSMVLCRISTAEPSTKEAAYNSAMQQQMGWDDRNPYKYYFDRYYHEILPNVLCGTQPRHAEDVRHLALNERVDTILNLQQDKDMDYWNVSIHEIASACDELGVRLDRVPARDFDPDSLRSMLPQAVQALAQALQRGERVYVHCTAGLGRSPAVIIAYMYWWGYQSMQLDAAYKHLTEIRPCGPKRDAIRGATYDLMRRGPRDHFPQHIAFAFSELNDDDRRNIQRGVMGGSW